MSELDTLMRAVRDALADVDIAKRATAGMVLADDTEAMIARHLHVAENALSHLQQELDALRAGKARARNQIGRLEP